MRWIHVTVIGKLGQYEELAHTMNFRTHPVADVDQDAGAIETFAQQVRDAWHAWFTSPLNANTQTRIGDLFTTDLQYTEVRAAYLEQTVPAAISTRPGRRGPVKVFDPPRANYLVDTQYATFAPALAGTSLGTPLPYEVAAALTFGTARRGPRYRGRLYLGGLQQGWMGVNGQFQAGTTDPVAASFGALVVNSLNANTGNRLHVVSRSYATSEGVNSVSIGHTPDSQRRRRRSVPELAKVAWQPAPA